MQPTLEVAIEISECSPALRDFVEQLLLYSEKLEVENRKLTTRVNQTSENSHRPPSSETFVRPKNRREKTDKKPGGQKGHPGKTLLRLPQADRTITLRVDSCSCCGMNLSEVKAYDHTRRQVQDIEIRTVSTDYCAQKKICPSCQKSVTARFPVGVPHYIQYGPIISAVMVYLNQGNHVPFDRLAKISKDIFDIPLSQGTLVNMVAECGISLEASMNFIKEKLLSAPVLHVDETGIRLKGALQWLHSMSNGSFTYLETHAKRGNLATEHIGLLPEYPGVLVHDFWKSYFAYTKCLHALCNAHILRELTGIVENFHLKWARDMKILLVELYLQVMAEGGFLVGQPLKEFKDRYDTILAQGKLEDPIVSCRQSSSKRGRIAKNKAQNLWERMFQYKDDILRFTSDWEIPFHNNQAERDIRMAKLFQKVSGGFRSETGSIYFSRIRSYLSSANKQGYSMFDAIHQAACKAPLFTHDTQ